MSTWSTSKKKNWLEITGQLWRWMIKMRKLFWLLLLTWRNAYSVIEAAARKRKNYTVAQWETAIQFAFKKNPAEVDSLKYNVINFQSHEAFPEYTNRLSDKAQENDIVLPNKESKVYWSKLMMIKFSKNNMDQMTFKYHYSDEEWKFITIYKPEKENWEINVTLSLVVSCKPRSKARLNATWITKVSLTSLITSRK